MNFNCTLKTNLVAHKKVDNLSFTGLPSAVAKMQIQSCVASFKQNRTATATQHNSTPTKVAHQITVKLTQGDLFGDF